jgi:hypothetical protein
MNTLSTQRPRPSMLIRIPCSESLAVKASLVNWLPWSELKICGSRYFTSASSRASRQKSTCMVLDSRQASTLRAAQSITATR